jgi:hypothetical protein
LVEEVVVVEEEEGCMEKWGTAAGQEVVEEMVLPAAAAALEWVVEVANLSEVAVVVQDYYFCSGTANVVYCDLRGGWG